MKHHRFRRLLSLILVAALLAGFYVPGAQAASTGLTWEKTDREVNLDLINQEAEIQKEAPRDPSEVVRVSIVLEEKSTIQAGYSTASIAANRAAIAYNDSLRAKQDTLSAAISAQVLGGKPLDVVWNLTLVGNLISANVPYGSIEAISQVEGVKAVILENVYEPCVVDREAVADPQMFASLEMTGSSMVWSCSYTGAGSRIAVIDTGTDVDHQSFDSGALRYALEQNAQEAGLSYEEYVKELDLLDAQEVASVLTRLNIYEKDSSLTAAKLYLSMKLPFAVNYVDNNSRRLVVDHASDNQSEHGSHVAGIATANRYIPSGNGYVDSLQAVNTAGTAPDAQLITMKVFGANGGPTDSDYMAAIEDAIWLGCDAVNLSLGSGMAGDSYNPYFTELLDYLTQTDTVVVGSAGNSYSWPVATPYGYIYSDDAAMDTVGSPGSYYSFFTVASVENDGGMAMIFEAAGRNSMYQDGQSGSNHPLYYLDTSPNRTGTEYDFVFIDGLGKEEDYAGINLSGKVVFCSRGETNFADKARIAVEKGAVATIIYNNQPGANFGMNLTGYNYIQPSASIAQSDANAIRNGATKKTSSAGITYYTGKITVYGSMTPYFANSEYYTMSDFSSWGVPGDLSLKPEITAPGGNIYSVYGETPSGGGVDQYELMSGTSMAAPSITGLAALMAQYLRESGLAEQEGLNIRTLSQSLLMSTAVPMLEEASGSYYSLLKQGAGLGRVDLAVTADSYILVDGQDDGKVKAELGDDPNRTGIYEFTFTINNLTGEPLSYTLSADVFRQDTFTADGAAFLDTMTTALPATAAFTVNGKPVVSGPDLSAYDLNGDGATNAQDADYLLEYLLGNVSEIKGEADVDGNGAVNTYDAHMLLTLLSTSGDVIVPANGSVTVDVRLELTASGKQQLDENFAKGTYVEAFVYAESAPSAEGVTGTRHSIPVLAFYGNWTDVGMFDQGTYMDVAYGTSEKLPYLYEVLGGISGNTLTVSYGDGKEYYFGGNPVVSDTTYLPQRNAINNQDGTYLVSQYYTLIRNADNLQLLITNAETGDVYMQKNLGYSYAAFFYVNAGRWYYYVDDIPLNWAGTDAYGNRLPDGTKVEVTVVATPEYYLNDDGTYDFDALGEGAYLSTPITIDNTAPEALDMELNGNFLTVSAKDNAYVAAIALFNASGTSVITYGSPNQTVENATVTMDLDLTGSSGKSFQLVVYDYAGNYSTYDIKLDMPEPDRPYFTVADFATNSYYGLNENGSSYVLAASDRGDLQAAEFVDGYVFEISDVDSLYVAADDDLTNFRYLGELDPYDSYQITKFLDLAMNYDDNKLYGLFESDLYAVTHFLCTIDMYNGSMNVLGALPVSVYSLTVDGDGNFYAIGFDGSDLYTFTTRDFRNNRMTYVGSVTGYSTTSVNSLAWDHNTDTLYWAFPNALLKVNTDTAKATKLNSNNFTTSGLYIRPEAWGDRFAPVDSVNSVVLSSTESTITAGSSVALTATVLPWNVSDSSVTWTSSNSSVATVSSNGVVTGVSEGTAYITATSNLNSRKYATCVVTVEAAEGGLKAAIWDADAKMWWASFDLDDLPYYKTLASIETSDFVNATMVADGQLYASTMDDSGTSRMYKVNPNSFDMTYVGTSSSVPYWNMSYAPSLGYGLAVYGDYVLMVDPNTGDWDSYWDWTEGIANSLVGITYYATEYNSRYGSYMDYFLLLDAAGQVFLEAFMYYDGSYYYFNGPVDAYITRIGSSVDSAYQGFYYDGTYTYWTRFHSDENDVDMLVWDCDDTGKVYNYGTFGAGTYPVTGLYTDADINGTMALVAGRGLETASVHSAALTGTLPETEITVSSSLRKLISEQTPGGLNSIAVQSAGEYEDETEQVVVTLTPAYDAPNGLATVTYDADALQFTGITGFTEAFAYSVEDGKITIAFASADMIAAEASAATLTFDVVKSGEQTITIQHLEAGKDSCNEKETITVEAGHAHTYEAVVTPPTCTEQGYTTYTCSICGESYVDDYVDALGHDHVGTVTEPTCEEGGYTTYVCSRCGDSYVGDHTDPVDHAYEDGHCKWCGEDEPEYKLGDVDGNGVVNTIDAMLVMQYFARLITADKLDIRACDVDGNGVVNTIDAMLIMQYFAKLIDKFPADA